MRNVKISDESFGLLELMDVDINDVIQAFSVCYAVSTGKPETIVEDEIYAKIQHLVLTVNEYKKLIATYKREEVDVIIEDMKNYAGLKKYKSAYLTANKWLSKRPSAKRNAGGIAEFGSEEWRKRNA